MNRRQKVSNGGFSIVELLITIAIMAVLMGIIAPILIVNVSKSRESTDLQNIDTIKDTVSYAMAKEPIANAHGGTKQVCTISYDASSGKNVIDGAVDGGKAFKDLLQADLQEALTESVALRSDVGRVSGVSIQIEVEANQSVVVRVVTGSGDSATTVRCKYTKDSNGDEVEMISK